jgi:Holliday junction resolvase RusA-like endonuclease
MQKIMIHGKLPTANEYIDACRKNRYAAAKMKRDAEDAIILQCKRLLPIKQKVRIKLTWYEETARRDPDNVRFGVKFILDALQRCGKLKNDNARWIAGFEDAFVYGKGQGVEVDIIPAI